MLPSNIMRLAKILCDVIKFPFVLGVIVFADICSVPWSPITGCGNPAVVIDRPVALDFKILHPMSRWFLRVSETVGETRAIKWLLLNAIDH